MIAVTSDGHFIPEIRKHLERDLLMIIPLVHVAQVNSFISAIVLQFCKLYPN